jgi:hypothetical protein
MGLEIIAGKIFKANKFFIRIMQVLLTNPECRVG